MFEKFSFSLNQIEKYYRSARKDFKIAKESDVPEVIFRFCYDALLKLAIAVCADSGLRAKARQGHHVELLKKLSFYLGDAEIEVLGNEMRAKRNWDLYGGGVLVSEKEAAEYVKWMDKLFTQIDKYFDRKRPKLKLKSG